jgi:hypothetical protein
VANLLKAQTNLGFHTSSAQANLKILFQETEVCYPHHEVAVADTANELLEEIPRLEQKGKILVRTPTSEVWTKQERYGGAVQLTQTNDHLILAESAGAADPVEELAAGGVLHDDCEVRRREQNLSTTVEEIDQLLST